jgi:hypothetical protein
LTVRAKPSRLSPLLALALAACGGDPIHPFGRWVGRVGNPCPGTALLDSRRGEAVFVRDDGAQVLRGIATPGGQVSTRLETPGMDKKGFVQTFVGQIKGDDATGTYTSPRCTAPVTMHAGG